MDDLVVNENPNSNYVKEDAERTPDLRKCFAALRRNEIVMPRGVKSAKMWEEAQREVKEAKARVEGVDYRLVEEDGKKVAIILVDGVIPKVRRAAPWLSYLNYTLNGTETVAESPFATVCTPYVFNKYKGIFGLTGSVGGKAELKYLSQTYKAIKFDVPRFLDTCTGNARKEVTNHGVEILKNEKEQIARVCEIAGQYFRKVPVLVIASSLGQLQRIYEACPELIAVKEATANMDVATEITMRCGGGLRRRKRSGR